MKRLLIALAVVMACTASLQAREGTFEPHTYRAADGATMPYQLFVPAGYDARRQYPLVLWLHGGGGRGNDNRRQLNEGNSVGAHIWTSAANQRRFPSIVVAPQCPTGAMWTNIGARVRPTEQLERVVALLKQLQRSYRIDPRRIYATGQSMGGFASWALIAEYPGLFAAAVPICGGGDEAAASRMKGVAIWAFHGELDHAVSVERSRRMIAALRRAGGKPRYTEYKGADHVVWNLAFAEPDLLPWLFAQRRQP